MEKRSFVGIFCVFSRVSHVVFLLYRPGLSLFTSRVLRGSIKKINVGS